MGWYGGEGGRLVKEESTLPGADQSPLTALDPNFGTPHCTNWLESYRLQIPEDWVSGIYLVKLSASPTGATTALERYMIFVVKAPGSYDLLWISPAATYHAYNEWHGNLDVPGSLYDNFATGPNAGRHVNAVSFNRPYEEGGYDGFGAGHFIFWEYPMLLWLERNGYDVTYATSEDLHNGTVTPASYKGLLSVGHDEYWSFEMRAALETAISGGVSVGFFGANPIYWQVRFEKDTNPLAANRNMVCYKVVTDLQCQYPDGSTGPAVDPAGNILCADPPPVGVDPWNDPASTPDMLDRITARWRDPLLARPEQNIVGQMYQDWIRSSGWRFPWAVFGVDCWAFKGTGLQEGDTIDGIIGGEFDRVFQNPEPDIATGDEIPVSTPPTLQTLAVSNFSNGIAGDEHSNSTIYIATSGARVFSAGTFCWSWGLTNQKGMGPSNLSLYPTHQVADKRLQRFTANILNHFVTGEEPGGARIGVLQQTGELYVKEGPLDALWWTQGFQIGQFALDGDQIGVLDLLGNLFVRNGIFGTDFVWKCDDVQDFGLSGGRIAVLRGDGFLYVTDTSQPGWVLESPDPTLTLKCQSFALSETRIGVVLSDGNAYVKEFNPGMTSWIWESNPVVSIALANNRIGVLLTDGNVYVKEGPLDALWTWESSNVESIALAGNRIGVLQADGNVYVKEGPLDALWTLESSNVQTLALSSSW